MRRQAFALRSLHSQLCVILLFLSGNLSWAQKQSFEQIPAPVIDRAVLHVPDLEGKTYLRRFSAPLPPIFEVGQSQDRSLARLFTIPVSYRSVPINKKDNFGPRPLNGASVSQGNLKLSSGGAPNRWLAFTPSYGELRNRTSVRNLEYYGQRIPFAGPLMMRVAKQAEAHPRVTRVVKILRPQF